jgi:hypothetical protein
VNVATTSAINPYESPRQPALCQQGPRVFTPFARSCLLSVLVVPFVVLALGAPALGTAAAYSLAPESRLSLWFGSLSGAALATIVVLAWHNVATTWGYRSMARRLARIWREAGVDVAACGGQFVELGAAAVPRVYHGGLTNWDIGFVFLTPERLVYLGDTTSFSVPREQIVQVARGPSGTERMLPEALYLRWKSGKDDRLEGFSLASAEGTLRGRQSQVVVLQNAIESWRAGSRDTRSELPPEWSSPPAPEFLGIPGRSLGTHLAFSLGAAALALIIGLGLVGVDVWQFFGGRVWMPSPLAAGMGGIALGLVGLTIAVLSPQGIQAAIDP